MINYTAIKTFNLKNTLIEIGDTFGKLEDSIGVWVNETLITEYTFYMWVGSIRSEDFLQLSGTQEPDPNSSENNSGIGGIKDINSGVDFLTIDGVDFGDIPTSILVTVVKPIESSDNIFATIRKDSITQNGFIVDFSSIIPSNGYVLNYFIIP